MKIMCKLNKKCSYLEIKINDFENKFKEIGIIKQKIECYFFFN